MLDSLLPGGKMDNGHGGQPSCQRCLHGPSPITTSSLVIIRKTRTALTQLTQSEGSQQLFCLSRYLSLHLLINEIFGQNDTFRQPTPTVVVIYVVSPYIQRNLFLGRFWTKMQSYIFFETVSTPGLLLDGFPLLLL